MAILCVAVSALVLLRRMTSMVDATVLPPGVAVTSGFEDESLFAVWRTVHGQPVYADTAKLPYASAYFNWLFYAGYAGPAALATWFHGDTAIPIAGRMVSLAGALLGTVYLFALLTRITGGRRGVSAGLACLVFLGPLAGWWVLTVRPDIWALTCETAGLGLLLLRHRARSVTTAALVALLFYAAWALKPTYVGGLATALLFLLTHRSWRLLAQILGLSLILWAGTFLLLGPAYRSAFHATVTTNVFATSFGLEHLRAALVRSLPLWLIAALTACIPDRGEGASASSLARDAVRLGALGVLVTVSLGFVASCKMGAASYYFLPTLPALALLGAGLVAVRGSGLVCAGAFALGATMQLTVLLGYAGTVDLRPQARQLQAIWTAWEPAAEPRFSHLTSLNLPWLNRTSPPLVLAYNYPLDRAAGRPFQHGGVGGLIESGFFQSLLLPAETGDHYDGGSLHAYIRDRTVLDLALYRRRQQ